MSNRKRSNGRSNTWNSIKRNSNLGPKSHPSQIPSIEFKIANFNGQIAVKSQVKSEVVKCQVLGVKSPFQIAEVSQVRLNAKSITVAWRTKTAFAN
jgi:hypothetical protein